jgi:hypothetical protein
MADTQKRGERTQRGALDAEQLDALIKLTLANAERIQPKAGRRRCAAEYVFRRLLEMGFHRRTPIQGKDILEACPSKEDPADPRGAVRGLMRDLKKALKQFFEEEPLGIEQRYSVTFEGDGNYLPVIRDNRAEVRPDHAVTYFWEPHKTNARPTLILFVEPQFFIDAKGTYFRNPGVNTPEQAAAQFGIEGAIKTSYSFVPSGIVQAMLHVMETLRPTEPAHNSYPRAVVIKHSTHTPPERENLVILATPTSQYRACRHPRKRPADANNEQRRFHSWRGAAGGYFRHPGRFSTNGEVGRSHPQAALLQRPHRYAAVGKAWPHRGGYGKVSDQPCGDSGAGGAVAA